jgi:hypothetical protein
MNTYEIHTKSFSCIIQADSVLEAIGKYFTKTDSTSHEIEAVIKV